MRSLKVLVHKLVRSFRRKRFSVVTERLTIQVVSKIGEGEE